MKEWRNEWTHARELDRGRDEGRAWGQRGMFMARKGHQEKETCVGWFTATGIMFVVSREKRLSSARLSCTSPGFPRRISKMVVSTGRATLASEPAACHIRIKVLQHSPPAAGVLNVCLRLSLNVRSAQEASSVLPPTPAHALFLPPHDPVCSGMTEYLKTDTTMKLTSINVPLEKKDR